VQINQAYTVQRVARCLWLARW